MTHRTGFRVTGWQHTSKKKNPKPLREQGFWHRLSAIINGWQFGGKRTPVELFLQSLADWDNAILRRLDDGMS
jgi:hypothetical protein